MAEYENRQRWDLDALAPARPAEADRPHRKRDLAARS